MRLNTKISTSVSLSLIVALIISTAISATNGYLNFKEEIRHEAENSLIIFEAVHTQAMLNRGTVKDNDPVINTMNSTLEDISENQDHFKLWVAMAPKVIAYQESMGYEEIEAPKDDIDIEAINTGLTVGRTINNNIFRLSKPVVLGQGSARNEKCFGCHTTLMDIKRGEVIGVLSIALSIADLWSSFLDTLITTIITTILVLVLVTGISVLLLRRLAINPISRMTNSMRMLADGDTAVEISDTNRKDEIGEMAEALEIFRGNAVELIFQKFALDEHAIVSSTNAKGEITYVNDKFCEISGYSREELMGQNHRMLKSDEHDKEFYKDLWSTIARGKTWHGDVKNLRRDGSHYWVKGTIVPFMNKRGKPFQYVSIRTNITEQRQAVKLKMMAHHDALTGLPNRYLFGDRLTLAINQAKRLGSEFVLLYLDLDKFKPINDVFGHDAGDAVLLEIAKRLKNCVRETDTVARIGGDEFAVIMVAPVPIEIGSRTAEKIIEQLSVPISISDHEDCTIGVSIGVSIYPKDALDAEKLIKCADIAMYKVKNSGRNSICFYKKDTS